MLLLYQHYWYHLLEYVIIGHKTRATNDSICNFLLFTAFTEFLQYCSCPSIKNGWTVVHCLGMDIFPYMFVQTSCKLLYIISWPSASDFRCHTKISESHRGYNTIILLAINFINTMYNKNKQ